MQAQKNKPKQTQFQTRQGATFRKSAGEQFEFFTTEGLSQFLQSN